MINSRQSQQKDSEGDDDLGTELAKKPSNPYADKSGQMSRQSKV